MKKSEGKEGKGTPTMVSPAESRWPQTFRALRHRNFRLYWMGQIVSLSGSWMQVTALNWLLYRLTDSPLMLGLVNFFALLPVGLVSLFGGVVSDRFPRRNLIIITQTTLTLQALLLTILTATGLVQVWHIIMVMFIVGAADAIEAPARFALLAEIVGREDLSNAVGLNSSMVNSARIVGPAIAGLLIGWIGEAGCFFLNGVTYLVVIAALLVMRLPALTTPGKPLRLKEDLIEGLRYVWRDRTVKGLLGLVVMSNFLAQPYTVLLPVFARDILQTDSRGYGLLMSAVGVGAVCGALGVASLQAGHRGKWLISGCIAFPFFLALFSFSRWLPISAVLLLLVGAGQLAQQVLTSSLLQLAAPAEFHGRVVSFFALWNNGPTRLGGVPVGALSQYGGAPLAILGGALVSMLWVLLNARRMPFVWRLP